MSAAPFHPSIRTDTNKEDTKENINFHTDTIPTSNEWKTVRAKKSNRVNSTNKKSPKDELNEKKDTSNYFSVTQDNEYDEEIERCSEHKENEIYKEASDDSDKVKATHNVESMSIDELKMYLTQDLEDNIREYKKKRIQKKVTKDTDKRHKELCYKDHHKSTREILLHENRIQVDQNK